jgi:DNA polymerase III alpha subunit
MVVHSFLASNKSVVVHNTDLARRDEVLDELRNFFGWENVVPISNYNCFKLKTLVKDIGKFYGIPFEETNAATRTVEDEVRKATMKEGDDKNLFVLTYDEAMAFHCRAPKGPESKSICQGCSPECKQPVSPSFRGFIEKYPVVAESIKILFKQNRSLGRHAGGVLIADDLPNKMPLVTSKGKAGVREPQSPWVEGVNYKHLEKIGEFIKYDLLGLETMRLIERAIELIIKKERHERGWFEIQLDDGTTRGVYGDQRIVTSNRGTILARELGPGDDIVSFEVPTVQ